MDTDTVKNMTALISQLRLWGWPHLFMNMGPNAILAAEPEFQDRFTAAFGPQKCRLLPPDEVAKVKKLPDGVHTVLVFKFRGELALVRQLRRRFPGKRILSAQYDIAPNSTVFPGTIPTTNPDAGAKARPPVLLLSGPCSDAEYLALLMEEAGLPTPKEYAGKPLIDLMKHVDPIRPLTYFKAIQRLHNVGGTAFLHLQSDVLMAATENTILSYRRLRWLLERSDARIIYLRRRDKLAQAGTLLMMEGQPVRSLWTIPSGRRGNFPADDAGAIDFRTALRLMRQASDHDVWLERLIGGLPHVHEVTLEEAARNPGTTVQKVADFLGMKADLQDFTPRSFSAEYQRFDAFVPSLEKISREMIDRMGIHTTSFSATQR